MSAFVHVVGRPELPPYEMPDRFRHDITYFCTPAGESGAPERLAEGEYFVRRDDAARLAVDGVFRLVSPLDSSTTAEIELTEEQEAWLEWMLAHEVEHVRLERTA